MRRLALLAAAALLPLALLSAGTNAADKDAKKDAPKEQNIWSFNPFMKNKYVQPYPPEKFCYGLENDQIEYRMKYSFQTKLNDRLMLKQEGEDTLVDVWFKSPPKIEMATGSKHGMGSLKEQLKDLQEGSKQMKKESREKQGDIKRIESTIKILQETSRKVSKFDGYRYQLRKPSKYWMVCDGKEYDLSASLADSVSGGRSHKMQETQVDEAGLMTEAGSIALARDEGESQPNTPGPVYNWWKTTFNRWWDFEELPVLPPDINYIRDRRYFIVEYIQADFKIASDQVRLDKSTAPFDAYCMRWYQKPMKELFPNLPDYSFKTVKQVVDILKKEMQKEDQRFRQWENGEFKKQAETENLYETKNPAKHEEIEGIALNDKGGVITQNNLCEFIGKEQIEVTGSDGKTEKYNCLHFRRTVRLDNFVVAVLDFPISKWQSDIWFDTSSKLTVKHQFALDFGAHFTQKRKNPNGQEETVKEFYDSTLDYTVELVGKGPAGDKDARVKELNALKDIVASFNKAVGTEYKGVLEKIEKFKSSYGQKRDYCFAQPLELLSKQCSAMAEAYAQHKGFYKSPCIYPDEFFCTYVPDDFNPSDKYGLIVFLPDGKDDIELRVKEWGDMLLGKKFIVMGYKPPLGTYNHIVGQTAGNILDVIRSLGKTYNIDPRRRFMTGGGTGAQMVLTMAAYSLSDYDRFPLYIPVSATSYQPFANDCRTAINGANNAGFQNAITSTSYVFIVPPGTGSPAPTGSAPDACAALASVFENTRKANPAFGNYSVRIMHNAKDVYSKDVASFILNQIIPRFENNGKAFFEEILKSIKAPQPPPAAQ